MKKRGGGFAAVVIGIILIIVCTILLFKNEGRAVNRAKALGNIEDAMKISSSNLEVEDGTMILIADYVRGNDVLEDEVFGVKAPKDSIKMKKDVSMYQWVETSTTKNDETTYLYSKEWSLNLQSSANFHEIDGHQNPASMDYDSEKYVSEIVMIGEYKISKPFVNKMGGWLELEIEASNVSDRMAVTGNTIFISLNGKTTYSNPGIGDYLITYQYIPKSEYTMLGAKKENQLITYMTKNGDLEEVAPGILSKEGLQEEKTSENTTKTWIYRVALIIGMIIGNAMIASPITKSLNFIPFLGNIVNAGIGFMGLVVGLSWGLIVIAIGWVVYRPLIGIGLLALVGVLIFLAVKKGSKKNQDEAMAVEG